MEQLAGEFGVAREKIPQPEYESIHHEGKKIMVGKIEIRGLVKIDQDEAGAPNDVDDLDQDNARDDVTEFPAAGCRKAQDQSRVEHQEFEAIADIGDREQHRLVGSNGHDGLEALIAQALRVHGRYRVKIAR